MEPLSPVPEQDTLPLCTPSSSEPFVSRQRRQKDRRWIQSDPDKVRTVTGGLYHGFGLSKCFGT